MLTERLMEILLLLSFCRWQVTFCHFDNPEGWESYGSGFCLGWRKKWDSRKMCCCRKDIRITTSGFFLFLCDCFALLSIRWVLLVVPSCNAENVFALVLTSVFRPWKRYSRRQFERWLVIFLHFPRRFHRFDQAKIFFILAFFLFFGFRNRRFLEAFCIMSVCIYRNACLFCSGFMEIQNGVVCVLRIICSKW